MQKKKILHIHHNSNITKVVLFWNLAYIDIVHIGYVPTLIRIVNGYHHAKLYAFFPDFNDIDTLVLCTQVHKRKNNEKITYKLIKTLFLD